MIKTVIFDFGNVVAFFDFGRTLSRLAPHTRLDHATMRSRIYEGGLEDRVERRAIAREAFLRELHQRWELTCGLAEVEAAVQDIFWPNPEVCELVPSLARAHRILLGSNTNEVHADHFRVQFADVLAHFTKLVLSHEVQARKPEREFYRHVEEWTHATPSECVFVDDLEANIRGAQAMGWHGILYRPGEDLAAKLRALGAAV